MAEISPKGLQGAKATLNDNLGYQPHFNQV
jgi:hypothetical protein